MTYRAPASLGQMVCGDAAESSKPHLEQRRQEMFFNLLDPSPSPLDLLESWIYGENGCESLEAKELLAKY